MPYPSSHHNTTGLSGHTLNLFEQKAMNQEEIIMDYFKSQPDGWDFSPEDILKACFDAHTPLTSCRRACTNLEKAGKIEKSGSKKPGSFGMNVNCYRLKK